MRSNVVRLLCPSKSEPVANKMQQPAGPDELREFLGDKYFPDFRRRFARVFFCQNGANKEMFDQAVTDALMPCDRHFVEKCHKLSSRADFRQALQIAAKELVTGPYYTFKDDTLALERADRLGRAIFGYLPEAGIPKVYVSDHSADPPKARVAERAIISVENTFRKGLNSEEIAIGLSCGSTVLRFVNLMLARLDMDQEFRELLKSSHYKIVELTSRDLSRDYLMSPNNCWNFYHCLKEHNLLVNSDSYCLFDTEAGMERLKKMQVVYCGLGDMNTSRSLYTYLSDSAGVRDEFAFEVNEVPFYKEENGEWTTLPDANIHMRRCANVAQLPESCKKILLVCGVEKRNAVANLLRCNVFLSAREQGLICSHLFLDRKLFDAILTHQWRD